MIAEFLINWEITNTLWRKNTETIIFIIALCSIAEIASMRTCTCNTCRQRKINK